MKLLADNPLIFLALVIGLGAAIGSISIRKVSLGPAAVLFTALGITAWGSSMGLELVLPDVIGSIGLVLFAFTTGMLAGPGFFAALRRSWPAMLAIAGVVVATGVIGLFVGRAMGIEGETIAGAFAGALTNTPSLAAAGGTPAATVGYASTYVFATGWTLFLAVLALRSAHKDVDAPPTLEDCTIDVFKQSISVAALQEQFGPDLILTRIRPGGRGPVVALTDEMTVRAGDQIALVGTQVAVNALVAAIGQRSADDLRQDQTSLAYRRIIVSRHDLVGRTVGELGLTERFGAKVVRLRRGDIDLLPTSDTLLQLGDRLRIVGQPDRLGEVSDYVGDSSRGLTELTPVALGLGIAAGLAIGLITFPLGSLTFSLGAAGGTLLTGLVLGKVGRVGRIPVSMPQTSASVVSELGLFIFLAYAGTKAGSLILHAIETGEVTRDALLGVVMTMFLTVATYLLMKYVWKSGGTRLAGLIGGAQTNPAVLSFANAKTRHDPRVAVGYALLYPAAMIAKILMAQILAASGG
ncbi:aspartate:alanine exchanger family transporter [Rarobacter faecitabidus]|uniref:Putative transport protein n=1 Tax=Rarobacter faecitabidus TaxID=13243 RepID=A0A542ZWT2_RARFA|nr:TrkA C-terminal domain-containing protein [Rarobacter faecitabidus]TQL64821.1 putative transport protein [Rarobacter faecitabidus]